MATHLQKNYYSNKDAAKYYDSNMSPTDTQRYTSGQNKFTMDKKKKWMDKANIKSVPFSKGSARKLDMDLTTNMKSPDSYVLRSLYDEQVEKGGTGYISFEKWKDNLPTLEERKEEYKAGDRKTTFEEFLSSKRFTTGIAYYQQPVVKKSLRGKPTAKEYSKFYTGDSTTEEDLEWVNKPENFNFKL